jgi:hypothetical protein
MVGVSVQRADTKPPFTPNSTCWLTFEKSLRLGIRLLDNKLTRVGLGEALAREGIGVFALDSLRRVSSSEMMIVLAKLAQRGCSR